MSESTSSESSSILSSPRVRKRKHFGDDFYVYDKEKKRKRSNKPNCDKNVQNGEIPPIAISPNCAANMNPSVLCSRLITVSTPSPNRDTDSEFETDEPKDSLKNGFSKHSTTLSVSKEYNPPKTVKKTEAVQVFSFSSVSDIGDYFKKEAMQLSNESNESSLQSEMEVSDDKHVELLNDDVAVGKCSEPCLKESNLVIKEDSNSLESAKPYQESNLVDYEEIDSLESKFEIPETPVSECSSLLLTVSSIPDEEETKDDQISKVSLNESLDVDLEKKQIDLENLESSKLKCNGEAEFCDVPFNPMSTRSTRKRSKRNTTDASVKEKAQKDALLQNHEPDLENDEMVKGFHEQATPSGSDKKLSSVSKKGRKSNVSVNKEPLKKRGRKPKSLTNSKPNLIDSDALADSKLKSPTESNVDEPSLNSDNNNLTITSTSEVCFSCKEKDGEVIKCSIESCNKYYHSECLNNLPVSKTEAKACSLHMCLTCHNSNPKLSQNSKGDMYKCFQCPTALHKTDACSIPGVVVITESVMSCPDHFKPEKLRQYQPVVNLPFCVVCGMNMDLTFCSLCPHSSHSGCQSMEVIENGINKCFRCVKRKILQFGDVVWAKVYDFRWWPAKIMRVSEVPEEMKKCIHYEGEFPVKFFGTGEIYWVQKSRVYPFVFKHVDRESLGVRHNFRKVAPSPTFEEALNEALKVTNNLIVSMPSKFQSESKKYPPYKHIKSNRPIGSVQIYAADEFDNNPCNCRADDPDPCGYDAVCLNRSMCTECSPDVCSAGDRCQNQKFQKRDYAPAKPYWTSLRGWGLQATADIKEGHFVSEYCGDLIDEEECQRRIKEKQAVGDNNFYFCTLDSNRIIDAGPKGNFSRFMNHSCEPNCVTQKWIVNGDARVGIFAKYDIPAGSELTFDYQMDFSHFKKLKCSCGSRKCSGIIGKKPQSGSRQKVDGTGSDVETSENSNDDKEMALKKLKGPKQKIGNGTSKMEETEVNEKVSVVKNVKKKSENAPNPKSSQKSDKIICFKCKTSGKLVIHCSSKNCGKAYHVRCVKSSLSDKESLPESWDCPRHFCSKCKDRATNMCSECPKSFCDTHVTKKNKTKGNFHCPKHA